MNYVSHYNRLIAFAKLRGWTKESAPCYTEKHHIIPRCMGGSDEESNLVELTAREHFLAHKLLHKVYPENIGLLTAVMRLSGNGNKYRNYTNRVYESLRVKHSENMSRLLKGKPKTKEHIEKVSNALKGRSQPESAIKKRTETRRKNGSYTVSESSKEKRRINRAKQSHLHNVPVCIFGIFYESMKQAKETLGVGREFLINRLNSDKFPDCYYL